MQIYIFGGFQRGTYDSLWQFDPLSKQLTDITQIPANFESRCGHTLNYISTRDTMITYGGATGPGRSALNTMWEYRFGP